MRQDFEAFRARTGAFFTRAGHNVRAWFARVRWPHVAGWTGGVLGVFAATVLLFLAFADWNAYRGPISRIASGLSGRPIQIAGDLDVHAWSLTPRIIVNDLRVGDPFWASNERRDWARDEDAFARVPRADAQVELMPLFLGRIVLRSIELDGPDIRLVRDEDGRANWSRSESPRQTAKPLDLPVIKRFVIRDGALRLDDRRRDMTLEATLQSDEELARADRPAFQLTGAGRLNNRPFNLEMAGGALINVRRDRPYEFRATLKAGPTHINAAGILTRPFDFGSYRANIAAAGADLSELYYIIGLSLPNTPPYNLRGVLTREETRYSISDITGRVGDSDLNGVLNVRTDRERPFVDAAITSRRLDFDDLAAVLGAPPATNETASPEQRAMAARMRAEGRLLPDARLDLNRVRNMDARLTYRVARVVDAPIPLRAAALDLTLDQGVLTMNPVRFNLNQGDIGGLVRIDARQDTPDVNVDLRLRNALLQSIIPAPNAISGPLSGRAVLRGRGATVRAAAATSNGVISFAAPRGEIRAALAELTGVNVIRGLGLYLSGDQSQTPIRCAVASFDVRSGQATPRVFVVDTQDVLIVGEGGVNLDTESLNLRLQGHPKEPRLIRVMAPITITGQLRSPQVGVDADRALGQAGIAGALGALLAPIAGILPFIDPGLADHADCAQLRAEARGAAPAGAATREALGEDDDEAREQREASRDDGARRQ